MAFLGQEEQLREFQDRFRVLYMVVFIALTLLVCRLVYLQIFNGIEMRRYAEENRIKRVSVPAPRGMIFDRNRKLLVDNHPAFDLEITPQYLRESKNHREVIQRLSKLIKMPVAEIEKRLEKTKRQPAFLPVTVKEDLDRDEVARIETWKIAMPGVEVETKIRRTSIFQDVASHLLGYISRVSPTELPLINRLDKRYNLQDNIGRVGIERQLESYLRGEDGYEIVEVDALGRRIVQGRRGRVIGETDKIPETPGKNVILTIDQDLQMVAREAFKDRAGGLVALNPQNGEILAMISTPGYDPTAFSRGVSPEIWDKLRNDKLRPLRDKAIQDHYPPGSVFKIVTAIAALEEGIINKNTHFSCPGKIRVGNRFYHCHRKEGHGDMDILTAIERSCDVFFYRVAQKFKSVDEIAKWAERLGLGKRTGIDLPREVEGLVPTESWKEKRFGEIWTKGETLTVAIGQSFVLTTVIQLANLYAAIANGGTLYRPHFVKAIENSSGEVIKTPQSEVIGQTQVSPATLAIIREGLWRVMNEPRGTAYYRRIPGIEFLGKTGTVQVVRLSSDKIFTRCENMKYHHRHHALFVGFAPKENPVIAIATIVEHGCGGSSGAAPVVLEVAKAYLEKYYPNRIQNKKPGIPAAPVQERPIVEDTEGFVVDTDADSSLPSPRSEEEPDFPVPKAQEE